MDPVVASVTIDCPAQQVFEYLLDVANHPEFCDHYLVDWHLTRIDSYGQGAGARFRLKRAFTRFGWADVTITQVGPGHRIVQTGRGGKFNRVRLMTVYELSPGPGGTTRVSFSVETEPATRADRLLEGLGLRGWLRRRGARAMRRLRSILEEGAERGQRATVADG